MISLTSVTTKLFTRIKDLKGLSDMTYVVSFCELDLPRNSHGDCRPEVQGGFNSNPFNSFNEAKSFLHQQLQKDEYLNGVVCKMDERGRLRICLH